MKPVVSARHRSHVIQRDTVLRRERVERKHSAMQARENSARHQRANSRGDEGEVAARREASSRMAALCRPSRVVRLALSVSRCPSRTVRLSRCLSETSSPSSPLLPHYIRHLLAKQAHNSPPSRVPAAAIVLERSHLPPTRREGSRDCRASGRSDVA